MPLPRSVSPAGSEHGCVDEHGREGAQGLVESRIDWLHRWELSGENIDYEESMPFALSTVGSVSDTGPNAYGQPTTHRPTPQASVIHQGSLCPISREEPRPSQGQGHTGYQGPQAPAPSGEAGGPETHWKPMTIIGDSACNFVRTSTTSGRRFRSKWQMMGDDEMLTFHGVTSIRKSQEDAVSAKYKNCPLMICGSYALPTAEATSRPTAWESRNHTSFLKDLVHKAILHQAGDLGIFMAWEKSSSGLDIATYLQKTMAGSYLNEQTPEREWLDYHFRFTADIVVDALQQMRDMDARNDGFWGQTGSWGVRDRPQGSGGSSTSNKRKRGAE